MTVKTKISTHTLTWSVTAYLKKSLSIRAYFNSHAHVERDMCGTNFGNGAKISTHTLTWSVTISGLLTTVNPLISTHTLTWSVTFCIAEPYSHESVFQLTRSRGA